MYLALGVVGLCVCFLSYSLSCAFLCVLERAHFFWKMWSIYICGLYDCALHVYGLYVRVIRISCHVAWKFVRRV
jgi:hypothetical protein